jgi:hypothetical protein
MASLFRLAAAVAAGAALMYIFDPQGGRRRRALARDRGVAAGHDLARVSRGKAKRAVDHLHGAAARTRARLRNDPRLVISETEHWRARRSQSPVCAMGMPPAR